jgi:hypothetical protein
MGSDFLGPITEETEHEFEYCNQIVGYKPAEYGEVSKYLEKVRRKAAKYIAKKR